MSEEKKPKAVITVTRATAQEEHCQITVNADEVTIDCLFEAVHAAGEALCRRVHENNDKLIAIKDSIPSLKSQRR